MALRAAFSYSDRSPSPWIFSTPKAQSEDAILISSTDNEERSWQDGSRLRAPQAKIQVHQGALTLSAELDLGGEVRGISNGRLHVRALDGGLA